MTIKAKAIALKKAQDEMIAELAKYYPIDSDIAFFIMHGQVNPSTGTVVGYNSDGYIRVRHHQAKERSRYGCRSVHHRDIC